MSGAPAPNRRWFLYWLIGFGLFAFGVPELVAVTNDTDGDTLSESVRWLTNTPVGAAGFVAFIAWFTWHILWQRRKR